MIKPNDMDRFTNNKIVEMYIELNQDLTKSIIKKIKSTGDISSFTKSQIKVLKEIGGTEIFKKALLKTNGLTSKQKKELIKLFNDVATTNMKGYSEVYESKDLKYELSPKMIRILDYAYKTTNNELKNLTKSIAYATKRDFITSVDNVYKQVITGAYDYDTAIKKSVRELAEKNVTLKTKDGRNEKIDVAVKRSLYTSIQQTANDISQEISEMIDANCVVIGHSYKCRPEHHVIDDVVMSLEHFKKYQYLTEEPNCNHIVNYDWRPEFEEKRKVQYGENHKTLSETKLNYEIQQKSNYYARQIRENKRAIASGDNSKEAKERLKNSQMKYRTYNKANKLEVDYSKTWVPNYNK